MAFTGFSKKFTPIYDRLTTEMNKCMQKTEIPGWMTKGKTTLIKKDTLKRTTSNNYRSITCLQMMFSEEQKGCRKGTRDTGKLPCIDQYILNESKTRRKNLAMAWIDNKKAQDMVPNLDITLKMYKIPNEVIQFIEKTMETWGVELTEEKA